jgi:hypothetical protein
MAATPQAAEQQVDASRAPARKVSGIVYGVGLGLVLLAVFNRDTTIVVSPLFGVLLPALVACVLLAIVWRRFRQQPSVPMLQDRWAIKSEDTRQAIFAIAALVSAAFLAFIVRDGIRNLAAILNGKTKRGNATVASTDAVVGPRNKCRELAAFELEDGRTVQICVRHKFRPDLIASG